NREVADADLARLLAVMSFVQLLDHGVERLLRRRPMDEEEIDEIDAQGLETLLDGCRKSRRRQIVGCNLRHQENVVALDAGIGNRPADFALIAVHLCTVDMADAELDRHRDAAIALIAGERPCAIAQDRDSVDRFHWKASLPPSNPWQGRR